MRLNFDDNYFNDRFQGIPIGGYTSIFEKMLHGIPLELKVDFLQDRDALLGKFDHVISQIPSILSSITLWVTWSTVPYALTTN